MLNTQTLLDAAKHAQGITSEYRLARVIGIGDNTLYYYRHGRTPDDPRALRLAELAGLNPGWVLLCLAAERAKDDATRQAFTKAADDLADALGLVFDAPADVGSDEPGTVPPADKLPATKKPARAGKTSMASAQNGDAVTSVEVEERNIVNIMHVRTACRAG